MSLPIGRRALAFAWAAGRYWLGTFPIVRHEMRRLRRRAHDIPDPVLRSLALDAQQRKWASLEGAAAFAAFAPARHRALLVRLLIYLQAIFDYADTLAEQPTERPVANARQLHTAFLVALGEGTPHTDYYRHHDHRCDGGYLDELVEATRVPIGRLPSYTVVAPAVMRHAQRIVFYQSHINLAREQEHPRLARWARAQPAGDRLRWWELAAACGSSLAVFAHLVAAASPTLSHSEAQAIDDLYWPWAQSLHISLDSLIDHAEDHATGQHNLLDHYSCRQEMAARLGQLARETVKRADGLPSHALILDGMVALYLSDKHAWTPFARSASERILAAAGPFAKPALLLLCIRRSMLREMTVTNDPLPSTK
jgi:tetraprenyl-beta-curcumene synthase